MDFWLEKVHSEAPKIICSYDFSERKGAFLDALLNVFIVKKPNPLFIFFVPIFPLLTK